MQNRYVGDFGDYVKLAILRALVPGRSLGVAWWLFPDEHHNTDGSHREYLHRPDKWKNFDPRLFERLQRIHRLVNNRRREKDVHLLEYAAGLPSALFAGQEIPCTVLPPVQRPNQRKRWLSEVKSQLNACNLVFVDPDNGIASEGLRLTWRRTGKSILIDEVREFRRNDRALVVYHHHTRRKGGHEREMSELASRLRKDGFRVTGVLRAKPWSPRAFFILDGDEELQCRAKRFAEVWDGLVSWHPDP